MFRTNIIETGYIMVDGGAMFGAVPKHAWFRKYKCDDDNLCPLSMRCLLAVSAERRILIDLGMGSKHLKEVSYYQPHNLVALNVALQKYSLGIEDITDVVLTHLHFDHCGGATFRNEKGIVAPAFPKASYWLSRKQWDNFNNPNKLEEDSFFADNIMPVYEAGLLNLIDGDTKLGDGFELRLFDGHTTGQIVAFIDTDNGRVVFPGDVIPTAAHVSLEWISAYDICALTSINEKERFLSEAADNGYTLVYCHDKDTISSKVKRLNDGYIATELIKK